MLCYVIGASGLSLKFEGAGGRGAGVVVAVLDDLS